MFVCFFYRTNLSWKLCSKFKWSTDCFQGKSTLETMGFPKFRDVASVAVPFISWKHLQSRSAWDLNGFNPPRVAVKGEYNQQEWGDRDGSQFGRRKNVQKTLIVSQW